MEVLVELVGLRLVRVAAVAHLLLELREQHLRRVTAVQEPHHLSPVLV